MNIDVREISELEFKELSIPVLFEDESKDRIFGVISHGKNEYKLGWQSDNIKPVVRWVNATICSIGIDLMFVIFEFTSGKIFPKIFLDYYFYDTKIYNGFIYVITQLEIIKIKITDLSIIGTYPLPDYFDCIEFNDGIVIVKCVGDEVVYIK